MGLKRRAFLQQAGLTLAALGISEAGVSRLGDRYYRALADTTSRKLALLVGINQYPDAMYDRAGHGVGLSGCVTDVELQHELLLHRFGFRDRDILTLTDRQATRENIEAAFLSHLTEQAQPGDIVVFHFSGYGSRVQSGTPSESPQSSLVPIDSWTANEDVPLVNDLSEETLLLLLRSLATNRVTTVLDASYVYPGNALQGNLRLRARPKPSLGKLNPQELAFQEQLLSKIKSSREQVGVERRSGQLPGVVLAAATSDELVNAVNAIAREQAFETQWNGFSAGLFTYALTQYLWSATAATTVQVGFKRATLSIEQLVGREQQPVLSGQQSREQSLLAYYLTPGDRLGAEGVIMTVDEDGKTGQAWLGGLPSTVLDSYGLNSLLTVASPPPVVLPGEAAEPSPSPAATPASQATQVQVTARNGLVARVKPYSVDGTSDVKLQGGQLLQEAIRMIPRNVNLAIALDSTLERIERVDATSAFSSVPHITVMTAGEQPADIIFSRISRAAPSSNDSSAAQVVLGEPTASRPGSRELSIPSRSYGLFSLGKELIPNTLGEGGEAVKAAIQRLLPHLKTRLAAKLLRMTANEGSSRLGVRATLELLTTEPQPLLQRETIRAPWPPSTPNTSPTPVPDSGLPVLSVGSHIRYRLWNYGDRPVYFLVLGLDSSGNLLALYSSQTSRPEGSEAKPLLQQEAIAPGTSLIVPKPANSLEWTIRGPAGLAETQIIFSRAPFTQTLATLEAAMRPMGEVQRISTPSNPLEVAQAILQDLHQASTMLPPSISPAPDSFALNVHTWATLSFLYQVVEAKRST